MNQLKLSLQHSIIALPAHGVIFDFQKSRSRDGRDRLLKSFAGTFQSDGYGLYESLERDRSDLRRVGCWAHARLKFNEAIPHDDPRIEPTVVLPDKSLWHSIVRRARS
jgi:hypothetical protein